MSKENEKTLEVYNQTANIYLSQTNELEKLEPIKIKKKQQELEALIKNSFSSLSWDAKVFEIGSGDGVNAKIIKNLGFNLTASDVAPDFINNLHVLGINAIKFNVLEDDFTDKYDAVFCWRVFVHFTKEDALKVIKKVYNALKDNGIFIFNAMNCEGQILDNEWVDFEGELHMGVERYYNYFYQKDLDDMIKETSFKVINFYTSGGKNNNKWLIYVLKK